MAFTKPENSLRINAEAFYDPDPGKQEVSVVANPIVNHHILIGVQTSQTFQKSETSSWMASLGVEFVDPNAKIGKDFDAIDPIRMKEANRSFDSDYFVLRPTYQKESYLQASLSHSNAMGLYSLHYFKLLSRPFLRDDFYSLSNRWVNTVGLDISINMAERFDFGIDYKYDLDRKDIIVVGEVGYMASQKLLMGAGVELLRSPTDDSFWSAYRTNDSLFIRLSYLF